MDPDAILAELRQAFEDVNTAAQNYDSDAHDDATQRIAELFAALDEWLTRGGFLPNAWRAPQNAARRRREAVERDTAAIDAWVAEGES